MPDNGAPEITPGQLSVMGTEIEIVADVDPAQFPDGIEFVAFKPGTLAPLGKILVFPGRMVAVLPAMMAAQIRVAVKKAQTLAPGQVDAPGVKK